MSTLSGELQNIFQQMVSLYDKHQYQEARKLCEEILKTQPNDVQTLTYLGSILEKMNEFILATERLEQLKILDPKNFRHYSNLGLIYQNIYEYEKAKENLEIALKLAPDAPTALLNYGYVCYDLGDFEESEATYRKIFKLKPDWARPHYNLSLLLLTVKRYEEAWKEFEWRYHSHEWQYLKDRNIRIPRWQGEDLRNKTLLVLPEQGFGDTIQFARFLSLVKKPDNHIVLESYPALQELMQGMKYVDQVNLANQPLPVFDYYISLLSLPYVTKTYHEVSKSIPYIHANPQKKKTWEEKLSKIPKKKVGICWKGNPQNKINFRRSCSLEELLPYYQHPQIQLVNLTKDCTDEEKALLKKHQVLNYFDEIQSFDDTAALIDSLDLVISIDTVIAHLSGALGKTVFLMLYSFPEWRYTMEPDSTTWYPTMKIFRQPSRNTWDVVFSNIKKELKLWLK